MCIELKVMFAAPVFYGDEASLIKLFLKLNGTSSKPFNVTIAPSRQSQMSAEGSTATVLLFIVIL